MHEDTAGDEVFLLPVDGSPASGEAARLLAAYRGPVALRRATLLNVQASPPLLWPGAVVDRPALDSALADLGHVPLEPLRLRLEHHAFATTCRVRLGSPARTIVETARTLPARMIVMGTRGHGAWHGFPLGSVAMRVAMAAPCPVLMTKPGNRVPQAWGRQVRALAAVDGSAAADSAVRDLLALRDLLGELVVDLVHVQAPLTLLEIVAPPHDDVLRHWSGRACEAATAAARRMLEDAGAAGTLHCLNGDAASHIVALADRQGAELVVMGIHGHGALSLPTPGSVALRVAALSPVPVLFGPAAA